MHTVLSWPQQKIVQPSPAQQQPQQIEAHGMAPYSCIRIQSI